MAVENAPVMDYRFASGRLTLSGHLAVPATTERFQTAVRLSVL